MTSDFFFWRSRCLAQWSGRLWNSVLTLNLVADKTCGACWKASAITIGKVAMRTRHVLYCWKSDSLQMNVCQYWCQRLRRKRMLCAPRDRSCNAWKYLQTGQISRVLADGENYDGNRILDYEWVKALYNECLIYNVMFDFVGIGNYFRKDGKFIMSVKRTSMFRHLNQDWKDSGKVNVDIKVQP